ncbi:hypothetical protein JHK85_048751 [Glycine max]|nr:hypothetical protein JHK85_048751 [Glycine max]
MGNGGKGSARISLLAPKAKCLSVSASLSQLSTLLCLLLAALPRLFPIDVTLSVAFCLCGLSLYADAFIPEGGHRLLDVTSSVKGSTQCDLDESKLRAFLTELGQLPWHVACKESSTNISFCGYESLGLNYIVERGCRCNKGTDGIFGQAAILTFRSQSMSETEPFLDVMVKVELLSESTAIHVQSLDSVSIVGFQPLEQYV